MTRIFHAENNADRFTRRKMLAQGGAGIATAALSAVLPPKTSAADETNPQADARPSPSPFSFCLNTATIRGQNLTLGEEVEIAATAGYDGIEPWIDSIRKYRQAGGSLADVRKRIADRGLRVESAIGFARWIGRDESTRKAGLEQARADMELVAQIGGCRIAAPPVVAAPDDNFSLAEIARWYCDLLDVGREMGMTPQLELWGHSRLVGRLGEAAYVVAEAARRRHEPNGACLLLDVYHIYKGGSDFAGLRLLNGRAMHVFHLNDYPAQPPRETIDDSYRVYPGDGVAPLAAIMSHLQASGFRGVLSLELFNREYWKQDPLQVAKTGLSKMKAAARLLTV